MPISAYRSLLEHVKHPTHSLTVVICHTLVPFDTFSQSFVWLAMQVKYHRESPCGCQRIQLIPLLISKELPHKIANYVFNPNFYKGL